MRVAAQTPGTGESGDFIEENTPKVRGRGPGYVPTPVQVFLVNTLRKTRN